MGLALSSTGSETDTSDTSQQAQEHLLFVGARASIVAGVLVGAVVVGSQLLIGRVYSGQEARALVVAMSSPVSALATAIISGLGTILALMLTMLSLSRRLTHGLHHPFFKRIQRIALLSIVDMIAAIVLLLILSSPIQETSRQAQQAGIMDVTVTYYLLIGITAVVSGIFVATIVMLYNAVQTVIQAVQPDFT